MLIQSISVILRGIHFHLRGISTMSTSVPSYDPSIQCHAHAYKFYFSDSMLKQYDE